MNCGWIHSKPFTFLKAWRARAKAVQSNARVVLSSKFLHQQQYLKHNPYQDPSRSNPQLIFSLQSPSNASKMSNLPRASVPHTQPSRLSNLPSQKARQLSHLHAQLAQLTAHMSDLENLLRMTAVQAESMRGLGGYAGAMFVASAKILGEETMSGGSDQQQGQNEGGK